LTQKNVARLSFKILSIYALISAIQSLNFIFGLLYPFQNLERLR